MHKLILLLLTFTGIALTGCAGINSNQASALGQTVTATSQTLGTALTNTQTADVDDSLLTIAKKGPVDADPGAVTPKYLSNATKAALISQFNALVQYSANLAKVTGSQTSLATNIGTLNTALTQASGDTNTLAQSISGTALLTASQATTAQKDIGTVSQAFAVVAQGSLNLYADHQAYQIATNANPAIQEYCKLLQHALGANSNPAHPEGFYGLYGLVYNAYYNKINSLGSLNADIPVIQAPPASQPAGETEDAYVQDKYLYATRVLQRYALAQQIYQLQQQQTLDTNTVLSLAKAVGQIAQAHQALVDKKKETFDQEISAAVTTLQNLASYYKAGAGAAATPSTTKPSTTTTTPTTTTNAQ